MLIEVLIALATVAPFLAWLGWRRGERITYQGNATVTSFAPQFTEDRKCYALIMLPGNMNPDLVSVDQRLNTNENIGATIKVVQKARWLEKPWLDTIAWPNEPAREAESTPSDGLVVGLYYIAASAGFGFLTAQYDLHQVGYLSSALALVMAGFCMSLFRFKTKDIVSAPISLLGFPLGRGPIGWSIAILILTAGTVWCFWQPGILMILGINLAMTAGMFCGMLLGWAWRAV